MPGSLPELDSGGGGSAGALQGAAALQQAKEAGIDIGAIIETVHHRVAPVQGKPGPLRAEDRLYRAEFGRSGLSLALRARLSKRELAARTKAWRASRPPEPGKRGSTARSSLPAEAIAFQQQPAFRIQTSAISRGATSLPLSAGRWHAERNEARRRLAAGLTERVVAREGRLEWEFLLPRRLPGSGELRIEAKVGAAGEPRRLGRGWRWALRSGRHVRLGELRVKDARGRELYRGLPRVSGRRVLLEVPASVLARGDYPLTLDPVISPEYAVSDPVYSPAPGTQRSPALAFDGTNYLVTWEDGRGSSFDVYGARVSPAGTLLDPYGIAISRAADQQYAPALAFDGTNYLVVWQQGDPNCGPESCTSEIYGAWVTPAGAVSQYPIYIATGGGTRVAPVIAFDGTNYLVAWQYYRPAVANGVYGTRVSPTGWVLDPGGIPLSSGAAGAPALAFDGSNYLVAWQDYRSGTDVYGARVSPAGTVLDPAGIPISTAANVQSAPALAFDGTNYLVAWQDSRSGAYDIYGARVSPAGTVLDSAGIAISTAANSQFAPALAFDGVNYVVAWEDGRGTSSDVYGARVSPAGTVLDPAGIAISTAASSQYAPALAFDGANYLVAWADFRSGAYDVYGARLSPAGTVLDPAGILISRSVNDQTAPALAFDGTNYLVAWTDGRNSQSDIYGARVSQAGTMLDPAGIPISAAANTQSAPALAFDGTNYLVVWADYRSGAYDVYGARVSPAGTVLDPGGIAISAAAAYQQAPALAFDGTNYLVAWEDGRTGPSDVYAARVSPAGAVLDPAGIPISTATSYQQAPALAFNGTNYLVAWQDYRSGAPTYTDLYGARVSPAGTVHEPAGVAISTAANSQNLPALAFDGTNYLVAWEDGRNGPRDIYGARVSPAGAVLEPAGIPISTATSYQQTPALAFDGTNYLVTWADQRSGTNVDVYGARVSPAGSVLDPAGLGVATSASSEDAPALTAGAPGRIAVGYHRVATEPLYGGADRVFLRFVDASPPNDNWADADDISGGFSSRSSTTANATGESGEPNHGGVSLPLSSVWYKFAFSTPKVVQLDTCGSSLDTVLAVYTGASVGSLTEVASNDDACGQQSRIMFRAAPGVMYTVAVDSPGSATGPFTLNFAERVLPRHPRPVG